MIKHLLAGAVASVIMSGAALAQVSLLPAPPPGANDTTIKAGIAPDGSIHASTTSKSVDDNGQEVKVNHSFQSGADGTRETHSQTQTDLDSGNSVTTSTTTQQR